MSWSLALVAVLAMLSAQADTWYLKKSMGTSKSDYVAMTDPSYWVDASGSTVCPAMNTGDTYVVGSARRLSLNSDYPFAGGPLVIGEEGQHTLNILYCNGHCTPATVPMTWYAGYAQHGTASVSGYSISMPVTVTAPAATPFGLTTATGNMKNFTVGTIAGDPGTGLVVGGYFSYSTDKIVTHSATNASYTIGSTANGYRGDLTVVSGKDTLEPSGYGNVMLFLSNYPDEICGAYEVQAGAGLSLQTQKELKLSSFTLHADSAVRFAVNGKNVPSVRVSETFAVPEDDGKALLFFSKAPARAAGDDAAQSLVLPLLTVPDTQTLDLSRFYTNLSGDFYLNVSTNDVAHTQTLELVLPGQVKLETADSTEYAKSGTTLATYGSALTNAAQWSDKALPHADANNRKIIYFFGQKTGYGNSLRTPYTPDAYDPEKAYVFPGRVLRATGTQAILTFANHQAFEVNLESDGASLVMRVANGRDPILRGTIRTDAGMTVYAYGGSVFKIESDISGGGDLGVHGYTGTGSPSATTWLKGDNSDWKGVLGITSPVYNGTPPNESKHLTIGFGSAESFGGRLDEMDYKALKLIDFSALTVENDIVLAGDMNRGIYVQSNAIVSVSANCSFVCPWPVTLNGTLMMKGTGTLALGGEMKFCDETGAVVDAVPAENVKRTFDIRTGTLKALAHNCVDGALLKPAAAVTFAIPFNPADANLKRYGFYNVKTATPFVEGKTINFKLADVDTDALEAARLTDEGYKQGLITVKTIAAKNVEDNLVVEKVKGLRLIREDDAETGTTTFSLYGKKEGMLLLVR